jgi:hypothetical protein
MALEMNKSLVKTIHVLPDTTHAKIDDGFNILTE